MKQSKKPTKQKKAKPNYDIGAITDAFYPFYKDETETRVRAIIKKHYIPYSELYTDEQDGYTFGVWAGGRELFFMIARRVLGREGVFWLTGEFSKVGGSMTPLECIEVQLKYDYFVELYDKSQKLLRDNFVATYEPFDVPVSDIDDTDVDAKQYSLRDIVGAIRFGYGHGKSNDTLTADNDYFKQLFLAYMEFAGLD